MSLVHLHLHTQYSLPDGANTFDSRCVGLPKP